jgi:hypothetical protein
VGHEKTRIIWWRPITYFIKGVKFIWTSV